MKYARNTFGLTTSKEVVKSKITGFSPAKNLDKLVRVEFDNIKYDVLVQKGAFNIGDTVYFIPADSLLPTELSDKLGVTSYLSKGVVKAIKLKGNQSEGIVARPNEVEPYLKYILKWENVLPAFLVRHPRNKKLSLLDKIKLYIAAIMYPRHFKKFKSISRIQKCFNMFQDGKLVFYSEKIHGMNFRCGLLKNNLNVWPFIYILKLLYWLTGKDVFAPYKYYIGTHRTIVKPNETKFPRSCFVDAFKKYMLNKIPKDMIFFGEIYGPKIQKGFDYGLDSPSLIIYAIYDTNANEYLRPDRVDKICKQLNIPHVKHYCVEYSYDNMEKLSSSKSEITDKHIREGIVIQKFDSPGTMAKFINFEYLAIPVDKRTEFH